MPTHTCPLLHSARPLQQGSPSWPGAWALLSATLPNRLRTQGIRVRDRRGQALWLLIELLAICKPNDHTVLEQPPRTLLATRVHEMFVGSIKVYRCNNRDAVQILQVGICIGWALAAFGLGIAGLQHGPPVQQLSPAVDIVRNDSIIGRAIKPFSVHVLCVLHRQDVRLGKQTLCKC